MNYIYLETFLGYLKITGKNQIESIAFVSKKEEDNANSFLKKTKREFLNYFKKQKNFRKLKINNDEQSLFQKEVFKILKQETQDKKIISYKQLAVKTKGTNYTRQVAMALSKNKFPILVPCHRVIYSNGQIGNYNLGNNIKHALINFENNNITHFKINLPKWFNWEIIQKKCKLIPFYKIESNCISYLSDKKLVNIRFSDDCLYVNFESNLNQNKVKDEIFKMFNLDEKYNIILNYFKKTIFHSLMTKYDFINQVYWTNNYQHLLRIIISQQMSNSASQKIYIKFLKLSSKKIHDVWNFPNLREIEKNSLDTLKSIGLTTNKAKAIKSITSKVLNNQINLNDFEKAIKKLLKIKGIGPWTINIFRMYSLKEKNLFPIKDLGIKIGIQRFFHLQNIPNEKEIIRYLAKINKYKTFLANALWNLKEKNQV